MMITLVRGCWVYECYDGKYIIPLERYMYTRDESRNILLLLGSGNGY